MGQEHVDGGVGWAARGAQELRRRVPGDHTTAGHEHAGRTCPQRQVGFQRCRRVDVGEQPLVAGAAQDPGGEQTGSDGGGAAERAGDVDGHAGT
jgi:hypothetical protein